MFRLILSLLFSLSLSVSQAQVFVKTIKSNTESKVDLFKAESSDRYYVVEFDRDEKTGNYIRSSKDDVLYDFETNKYTRDGWCYTYKDDGSIWFKNFYVDGSKHKTHSEKFSGELFGVDCAQIPILYLNKNDSTQNSSSKAKLELPNFEFENTQNNCLYYDHASSSVVRKEMSCSEAPLIMRLPNLLEKSDANYTNKSIFEFELDFIPQKPDNSHGLIINLGEGDDVKYRITMKSSGEIELGSYSNLQKQYEPLLRVYKATQIKWGEENHFKLLALSDGSFILKINDYFTNTWRLKHELKLSSNPSQLFALGGLKNSINFYTEVEITKLYIGMLRLTDEEDKKSHHPFKGLTREDLYSIGKFTLEKKYGRSEIDNILLSFVGLRSISSEQDIIVARFDYLKMPVQNDGFNSQWFNFYLDKTTNAIELVKVTDYNNQETSYSADEFYKSFVFENKDWQARSILQLQENKLYHSNNRPSELINFATHTKMHNVPNYPALQFSNDSVNINAFRVLSNQITGSGFEKNRGYFYKYLVPIEVPENKYGLWISFGQNVSAYGINDDFTSNFWDTEITESTKPHLLSVNGNKATKDSGFEYRILQLTNQGEQIIAYSFNELSLENFISNDAFFYGFYLFNTESEMKAAIDRLKAYAE